MLDVFGLFSVNELYVLIGIIAFTLIAIILSIVAIVKSSNMKKKYNMMMEGSDGKSIEALIKEYTSDIKLLKDTATKNTESIKDIYEKLEYTFTKIGIVKYDAFHEMGGKLSFALCMLDKANNGYVINVMHSNTGCFAYVKEIVRGESFLELGDEEEKALNEAIAGRLGDASLSKEVNDLVQQNKM